MIDMVKLIKSYTRRFGIEFMRTETYDGLLKNAQASFDLDFLKHYRLDRLNELRPIMAESQSQLRQDLFVLGETRCKKGGYFVEFGAADGVHLSNTLILERKFNWEGILAEPARAWHASLFANRSCNIEKRCVWKNSGEYISFSEDESLELSTMENFIHKDYHSNNRLSANKYLVETISLTEMLEKNGAPSVIDYLSIDTEGSEYEILLNHDFNKYKFKIITCEHNFTENRSKIYDLLTGFGYERVYTEISKFDDWYILHD